MWMVDSMGDGWAMNNQHAVTTHTGMFLLEQATCELPLRVFAAYVDDSGNMVLRIGKDREDITCDNTTG